MYTIGFIESTIIFLQFPKTRSDHYLSTQTHTHTLIHKNAHTKSVGFGSSLSLFLCDCLTTGLATLNQPILGSHQHIKVLLDIYSSQSVMRSQLSFPHLFADGCHPFRYISRRLRLVSPALLVVAGSANVLYRKWMDRD